MVQVLCGDLHNHTLSLCHAPLQNLPMRKTFNITKYERKIVTYCEQPDEAKFRKKGNTKNMYKYTTKTHKHSDFFPTPFCFIQFLNFHLPRNPRYCACKHKNGIFQKCLQNENFWFHNGKAMFFCKDTCLDGCRKFHYYILSRQRKKAAPRLEGVQENKNLFKMCLAACMV